MEPILKNKQLALIGECSRTIYFSFYRYIYPFLGEGGGRENKRKKRSKRPYLKDYIYPIGGEREIELGI